MTKKIEQKCTPHGWARIKGYNRNSIAINLTGKTITAENFANFVKKYNLKATTLKLKISRWVKEGKVKCGDKGALIFA